MNQQPHRQVCHVIGKHSGNVGNPNAESAALEHVNVVTTRPRDDRDQRISPEIFCIELQRMGQMEE